jgi:hypothetical protein
MEVGTCANLRAAMPRSRAWHRESRGLVSCLLLLFSSLLAEGWARQHVSSGAMHITRELSIEMEDLLLKVVTALYIDDWSAIYIICLDNISRKQGTRLFLDPCH